MDQLLPRPHAPQQPRKQTLGSLQARGDRSAEGAGADRVTAVFSPVPPTSALLGLIVLEQCQAQSPLFELARPSALPQMCEAKSAQPYGDGRCPLEKD